MGNLKFGLVAAPALLALLSLASPSWADQSGAQVTVPTTAETSFNTDAYVYYNSNIAASDEEVAAERRLKLADVIFAPSGNFTLSRLFGSGIVFLKGDGGYDYYAINTIRNHPYVDLDGGAATHFGPCQEVLTGGYGLSQVDLADITLGPVTNLQERENVKAAANCGRTTGFAPNVSVEEDWVSNSNQLLANVDARSFKLNGGLAYQRPAFGSIAVFGLYDNTVYPERLIPGPNGSLAYSYNLYVGGLRYDRHIGSRIDAVLEVSYSNLDPSSAGASKFSGLTYSLDGTYHLSSRIDLHADAIRATMPSTRIDANFSIDETYQVDVAYHLGARITLKLLADRKSSNFIGNDLMPVRDLTQETTYDVDGSVTYQLNRRFSVVLSAGDRERSANYPGLSYSSTTAGVTVKAAF